MAQLNAVQAALKEAAKEAAEKTGKAVKEPIVADVQTLQAKSQSGDTSKL